MNRIPRRLAVMLLTAACLTGFVAHAGGQSKIPLPLNVRVHPDPLNPAQGIFLVTMEWDPPMLDAVPYTQFRLRQPECGLPKAKALNGALVGINRDIFQATGPPPYRVTFTCSCFLGYDFNYSVRTAVGPLASYSMSDQSKITDGLLKKTQNEV